MRIALFLAGCSGDPSSKADDVGATPSDSGTTPIVTTDTDTDTETTPPPTGVAVTDLGWSLNPEVGSVVDTHWTQDVAATVHVEYSFDSGVWASSPPFAAEAGVQHQVLVGIPFATVADWRVVVEANDPVDGDPITTAPVPEDLPLADLETDDPAGQLPSPYLLASLKQQGPGWTEGGPVDFWVFIVDRQGRPVWAKKTPRNDWTLFPQISVTGDYLMWDQATYWSQLDNGAGSVVHQTWLDEEFGTIATPGVHQAWLQEPDGTLAWPSRDHGGTEAVVEKAAGQPDETVLWTCSDDWPQGDGYNCHCNGLYYRASTDSFLLSFPLWATVLEASEADGTLWYAGGVGGGYAFDPPNYPFEWEHGVSFTDTDTLLMSSNHSYTTWAMEWEVDRANGVVRQVWGSDSGARVNDMGQAWRLSNGNTLHLVGDTGIIREVTPDDTEVWQIRFPGQNLLGRGELVADLYALVKPH